MKQTALLVLLVSLIPALCTAGVIWSWDLTELPTGWTEGACWTFSYIGASCSIDTSYMKSQYESRLSDGGVQTSLLSNVLIIPDSIDTCNLTISFYHDLWTYGGNYDQLIWISIEGRAILNDSTYYPYDFYDWVYPGVHSWEYWEEADQGIKTVTIEDVHSGDQLVIEFFVDCVWYGVFGFCQVNWDITDLVVEADFTHHAPSTWAAIKTGVYP